MKVTDFIFRSPASTYPSSNYCFSHKKKSNKMKTGLNKKKENRKEMRVNSLIHFFFGVKMNLFACFISLHQLPLFFLLNFNNLVTDGFIAFLFSLRSFSFPFFIMYAFHLLCLTAQMSRKKKQKRKLKA